MRKILKTGIEIFAVIAIAALGLICYSSYQNNSQNKIDEVFENIVKEFAPHPYILFDIDGDGIDELMIGGWKRQDIINVYRNVNGEALLLGTIPENIEDNVLFRCNYNSLIGLGTIHKDTTGEDSGEEYGCYSITDQNKLNYEIIAIRYDPGDSGVKLSMPIKYRVNIADFTKGESKEMVDYSKEDFEKLVTELTSEKLDSLLRENPSSEGPFDEISAAVNEKIVPENLQGEYSADITRKELCQLVMYTYYRKESKKIDTDLVTPFDDVDDPYVTAAYNLDIISASEGNNFDPDGYVTRQEAAVILDKLAELLHVITFSENTDAYTDEDQFAPWAKDAISSITAIKSEYGYVMEETEEGKFSPLKNFQRGEAITSLWRLYKYN